MRFSMSKTVNKNVLICHCMHPLRCNLAYFLCMFISINIGLAAPIWAACYIRNANDDFTGIVDDSLVQGFMGQNFYIGAAIRDNRDLSTCNMSGVTNLQQVFDNKNGYTGDISEWDVSNVTNFSYLFRSSDFAGDISKWDLSSATTIDGIFSSNTSFLSDISDWNVSNVTSFI